VGQLKHYIQCLGVVQSEHYIQCLGVVQLEHYIQCLGVGELEHYIQCLGVGQSEHHIQCLGVGLSISVILCVVYLLHTYSLHFLLSGSCSVLITSCCIVPAGKNPLVRQHVVVCYVAEWARLRQGLGSFTVDNIDPTLCTHLVYAFAVVNMATNAIESASPKYDLEDNNGTGWCIQITVRIVSCVNPSQVQDVR